ncbi:MAG: hypothetical protein JW827_03610 [Spirochaetes bacterium]|nr:hypothetical protein [Spirochaetota bacterium]
MSIKKFATIFLLILVSFFFMAGSCSKEDNPVAPTTPADGGGGETTPNTMTFTFNTTPKDWSDYSSVFYDSGTTTTYITARETGTNAYPNIQIMIPGKDVTGTWTQADAGTGILYAASGTTSYFGTSYTIMISSYGAVGSKVTGNFWAQLTGTVAPNWATNGYFNVTRLADQ